MDSTMIERMPKGYVNARRNAGLKFIFFIYSYCIFNFLVKRHILAASTVIFYGISFSLAAICLYSLIYYIDISKYFNKTNIMNYQMVSTINPWAKLLLWIPIFSLGYFIFVPFVILFCILSAAYLYISTGLIMD